MNDLVFIDNKEVYTDSLKVAEVFNKKHKNVLRDIERVLLHAGENIGRLRYEPSNYIDLQGKTQRKYFLCKDALMLLVMGYSGSKAFEIKLKYIESFNSMAELIKSQYSLQDEYFSLLKERDKESLKASEAGFNLNQWKYTSKNIDKKISDTVNKMQVDWLKDLRIK